MPLVELVYKVWPVLWPAATSAEAKATRHAAKNAANRLAYAAGTLAVTSLPSQGVDSCRWRGSALMGALWCGQ